MLSTVYIWTKIGTITSTSVKKSHHIHTFEHTYRHIHLKSVAVPHKWNDK